MPLELEGLVKRRRLLSVYLDTLPPLPAKQGSL
jgi:hypothetical protein